MRLLTCTNDRLLSTNSSTRCRAARSTFCSAVCCACSSATRRSRSAVTKPAIVAGGGGGGGGGGAKGTGQLIGRRDQVVVNASCNSVHALLSERCRDLETSNTVCEQVTCSDRSQLAHVR